METFKIDANTGLPELPEGFVWELNIGSIRIIKYIDVTDPNIEIRTEYDNYVYSYFSKDVIYWHDCSAEAEWVNTPVTVELEEVKVPWYVINKRNWLKDYHDKNTPKVKFESKLESAYVVFARAAPKYVRSKAEEARKTRSKPNNIAITELNTMLAECLVQFEKNYAKLQHKIAWSDIVKGEYPPNVFPHEISLKELAEEIVKLSKD